MSVLPRLDDRTYEQLLAEARAVIPAHAPEWTDHNPGDPGIALLELFAWLAEMLVYRADQITDAHLLAFVRLLRGPDWTPDPAQGAAEAIDAALAEVRAPWRAVTPGDYAAIAPGAAPERIVRVHCVPRRDLAADPAADAPGTISVIVLPALNPELRLVNGEETNGAPSLALDAGTSLWIGAASPFAGVRVALSTPGAGYDLRVAYHDGAQFRPFTPQDGTQGLTRGGTIAFTPATGWAPRPGEVPPRFWLRLSVPAAPTRTAVATRIAPVMPQPDPGLLTTVRTHLEPRRIVTTRPVVLGAAFAPVGFDVLLARVPGTDATGVHAEAARRLEAFADPLTGGPDGAGWTLGRSVYIGELEHLLDDVPGVDHVVDVLPSSPPPAALLRHANGDPVGLDLPGDRLPDARVDEQRIVSGERFVSVTARLAVQAKSGTDASALRAALKAAVREFFHPLSGGPNGGAARDWPVADLETRLRTVAGVDQLTAQLQTVPARMGQDSAGLPVLGLLEAEFVDVTTEVELA